jgi:hypothetical protein
MTSDERLKVLKELIETRIVQDSRVVGGVLFGNFAAIGLLASMSKDSPLRHGVFAFLALVAFLAGVGLGAFSAGWLSDDANSARSEIIRFTDQEISSDRALKVYNFMQWRTALSMFFSCCALFLGVLLSVIGLALG